MTPSGYQRLIEHEGCIYHAYPDSLGYLTIGYGHCVDERKGCGISDKVARILLDDDIAKWTAYARGAFEWFDALDEVRQDVIVMLCFNMGNNVKTFKLMLDAIKWKNWDEAAFQLANSDWGRQVGITRKRELCNALKTGRW